MGHRSIRVRILAAFFLAFIALASTIAYGIGQLRDIGQELDAVNTGFLPMSKVSVELSALVRQLDRDHDRFARQGAAGRRANAALYRAGIQDLVQQGRTTTARAQTLVKHPDDHAAISRVDDVLIEVEVQADDYENVVAEWLRVEGTEQTEQANRLLADLDRRRQTLSAAGSLIQAIVDGQVEQVSRRTAEAQNRALLVSVSLGGISLILASLITGFALRALRPIGELTAQVQRVAAGDLTGRVEISTDDEMGVLAQEFNTMAEAVAERDHAIQERAETLDQLQLRLRKVLNTITSGLIVTEEGQIHEINPAAATLWSLCLGEHLPGWLASLEPGLHESVSTGHRLYTVHVEPFGAQGTLIVGEDVTERVQVRERLMRTERLALVGRMLAQITHEVRNPLNAMSLNAEMLGDELKGKEATAMLATITGEIRRLEHLTGRYLHLSRKRVPQMARTSPRALVERVVNIEQAALNAAGVQAVVEGEAPTPVEIDVDAVERTLRNLLRNAVEAGADTVTVCLLVDDTTMKVTVSDNGPGMTTMEAAQAFDPFFTTKASGTGLGLAIGRQELEEIGGRLDHEADRDGGARFVLDVPIKA
jgi:nitrogen fixation/metabolism regulation signal transduction histidine kinase